MSALRTCPAHDASSQGCAHARHMLVTHTHSRASSQVRTCPEPAHALCQHCAHARNPHTRSRESRQHCGHAWRMRSTPAQDVMSALRACPASQQHTRSRASCQHCTHARQMIRHRLTRVMSPLRTSPANDEHTRSRASCQHCAHARRMRSTPVHARHVSTAHTPGA